MCLCYGSEQEGIFKKVHLPQDMQSPHTLVAKENAQLAPIGDSDHAWVGML